MTPKLVSLGSIWLASCLLLPPLHGQAEPAEAQLQLVKLPGLRTSVRVRRDLQNTPHIFASTDHDALFMLGYVQAQDRFFQMDTLRHTFSGTAAELFGTAALEQDVLLRTLGLRRAAEASEFALSAPTRKWLAAFTAGVNAYLADPDQPWPLEYQALELTRQSIAPWTIRDSLVIVKGLSFGLSFDLSDLDYTVALLSFQAAGEQAAWNGAALFFEDLYRSAPFDPAVSIPPPGLRRQAEVSLPTQNRWPAYLDTQTVGLIRGLEQRVAAAPILQPAFKHRSTPAGSNWWLAHRQITESGAAMLASDPHLALGTPATFYEVQLRVSAEFQPPMNVIGVSFPGTPGVVLGCNPRICWGATVNALDVTDVYVERLVLDPATGLPTHTVFGDHLEPLIIIPQTYLFNVLGDGLPDNLTDAGVGPLEGGLTLIVPRRNHGPIVAIDPSNPAQVTGLSIQYTGWGATQELETLRRFGRAADRNDFRTALQFFDVGSQNWAFADRSGNIAYYTSAELPIREDFQKLGFPDGGVPPYLVRDGTHTFRHEWLPVENPQPKQALDYEILPFGEMPQVVNPDRGYILNANNDPLGITLDNHPFNQLRPGGGLFYLAPGYDAGYRMGRLERLFDTLLAAGNKLTVLRIQDFQANHQLLDAEVLMPYILQAWQNAQAPGAPSELGGLVTQPRVVSALLRLAGWDFSTPTGITEGFDPGDDPTNLAPPSAAEIDASVAATIYAAWRSRLVRTVIDGTLAEWGLDGLAPGDDQALAALRNLLDRFEFQQGVGVSGVNFFAVPGLAPEAARDFRILDSLRQALVDLASAEFAPAFGGSLDLDDYRWGKLHRIVFAHPMGGPFNIPAADSPGNLSPELPGFARSGGFGVLDAASHSVRASGANDFMFDAGPSRRFIGYLHADQIEAWQVIPGGESGHLGDFFQIDQLLLWLTNQVHPLAITPDQVVTATRTYQRFVPAD